MKKMLKMTIIIVLVMTISLLAKTPDLTLQKEITAEYMAYLDSMETEFLKLLPGADDTQTMKAHMGLAIIQAARTYVNGDTLINDLEYYRYEIENNVFMIVNQTFQDIFPLFQLFISVLPRLQDDCCSGDQDRTDQANHQ